MFCDPVVCDISQQIGLLSIGATDTQIAQLGHLYWFTIEFGACR
jgi:phenylalanine-4-hydroxylase